MNLAYMSTLKEDGKYIGGILVVDEHTIPVEFKYTDPFQPTRLQRVLYGKSLESYLEHGLILKSLLCELESKSDFLFVDNLGAVDFIEGVVFLQAAALAAGTDQETPVEEGEYILPLGKGKGLRIVSKTPLDSQKLDTILQLAKDQDIFEPFTRLKMALRLIISGEVD